MSNDAITSSFVSAADGTEIATFAWPAPANPVGVVQLAHGLAEHSARYARLAHALNQAGYTVFSTDHRGHGVTGRDNLGDFGPAGFEGLIADVAQFGAALGSQHPGLPVFLIGHSMGSFAAQAAITTDSAQYAGVVLSGSTSLDVLAANLANAPADAPPGLEGFNVGFEHRTGFEWLSRDDAEVDLYVADPWCGFETPPQTLPMLFGPASRLADPAVLAGIRPDLPVLIVSGTDDPLAGGGELLQLLGSRYRGAGLQDVTVTLYPGARHEIFNEINRDDVTGDVVTWLRAHTDR